MLRHTFQDSPTPDINLDQDVIALGIESGEIETKTKPRFAVNIYTIIISALIFLSVLAWFDWIQSTFYAYEQPEITYDTISLQTKLKYAIGVTIFVAILVVLIYINSPLSVK